MEVAVIGLGRLGSNVSRRLMRAGHKVVAFDSDKARVEAMAGEGAAPAASIEELVGKVHAPRVVCVFLQAGEPTRAALAELRPCLASGDVVVDGGTSDWREDAGRAALFDAAGVAYLDVGVAGGASGLVDGWCLMIGGEKAAVDRLKNLFDDLAAPQGLAHVGASGAGHYAKMVHNAVEYGVMESLAEGFELLRGAPQSLDVAQVANLWRHGSGVRSWLLDQTHATLKKDAKLEHVAAYADDSEEGRWAVETALAQGSPCTILAASLFARFRGRRPDGYASRLQAALRRDLGGPPAGPSGNGA